MGRIIGIDYGMARIGLAYSDERKIIAMPMTTLTVEKKSQLTMIRLANFLHQHEKEYQYQIEKIVVGFPLLMSGKKGLLADEVTHFIDLLKETIPVPIIAWDERLSSVQADRFLREGNLSRKKRAQKVDSLAAVIILQNYLDFLRMEEDRQ